MAYKKLQKSVEQDPRYHDTWRLLKKYRDGWRRFEWDAD